MDNNSKPTPEMRITGPTATCSVGIRFSKRILLCPLKKISIDKFNDSSSGLLLQLPDYGDSHWHSHEPIIYRLRFGEIP